jgi:hypothetical protein
MAHVTLDAKEVLQCLVSLLKRLGDAISWVSKQQGKITFDVPDQPSLHPIKPPPVCGTCFSPIRPVERADTEIMLGILKVMRRKGHRPPKPRRRK